MKLQLLRLAGNPTMRVRLNFFVLSFAFMLAFAFSRAQTIRLRNETLTAIPNIQSFADARDPYAHSEYGRSYVLLQFAMLPSPEERNRIEAAGIQLHEYIPKNAYVASVHNGFPWHDLGEFDIRFVSEINPLWKIHPQLTGLPLPAWAMHGGYIRLDLLVFSGCPVDETAGILRSKCYSVISTHADFGQVIVDLELSDPQEAMSLFKVLAEFPFIANVAAVDPPPVSTNNTGRTLHRSSAINTGFSTGRHYDGTGVRVALGDNGLIGPHIDYKGRYDNSYVQFQQDDGTHGDHTAGTIMGAGNFDPLYEGMAKGVDLDVYYFSGAVQNSNGAHVIDSVMVTSNSWSNGSDGCNGGYSTTAVGADKSIRQNPGLAHVFSAGNEGGDNCGYGAGSGWGNIAGGQNNSKNTFCIGSVSQNDNLSGFSSRGPAYDGRIKPDVVGKGANVTSTYPNNTYGLSSGTSMSCPGVAGTMAQLCQAFRQWNGGANPHSALLKACMMNTADDLGNAGPDFKHGYGRINALRAVKTIENAEWMTDSLSQGDSSTFNFTIPAGTAELRVMLYWTDWEASTLAAMALVNDLDIAVTAPGPTVVKPWVLNHSPNATALNSLPNRTTDTLNNTEQVTIANPTAGSYQIKVKGTSVPQGPQTFFVVYEIRDSSVEMTFPVGGEGFTPGEALKLRWDAQGNWSNFKLEYSPDSGANWSTITNTASSSLRQYDWTTPGTVSGNYLVRVSRGNYSDLSDSTFSVIGFPSNLQIKRSCPAYAVLKWTKLSSATAYEAFLLGTKYMEATGITSDDTIVVTGLNSTDEFWFSVRTFGANNAKGRRMDAVSKSPGVFNCQEPNDVALDAVLSPGPGLNTSCTHPSAFHVKVRLENFSPNAITGVPVFYQYDGGAFVSDTFTGTLGGYSTATHTFLSDSILSIPSGNHSIRTWIAFAADVHQSNDSLEEKIEVIPGVVTALPYSDDLELFPLCNTTDDCGIEDCIVPTGWINVDNGILDDIDWRTNMGSTPSAGTGPDQDYNPGTTTGRYVYLEATNCFDKRADLMMQCLDLSSAVSPSMSFNYQMNGATMGELHVDLLSKGEWIEDVVPAKSGNFSTIWWPVNADLSPWAGEVVAIRFRGITGPDYASDMALDNFKFLENAVGMEKLYGSGGMVVYPNPSKGNFVIAIGESGISGQVRIRLSDSFGKLILEKEETISGNKLFETAWDASECAGGVYILHVENGNRRWKEIVMIR